MKMWKIRLFFWTWRHGHASKVLDEFNNQLVCLGCGSKFKK